MSNTLAIVALAWSANHYGYGPIPPDTLAFHITPKGGIAFTAERIEGEFYLIPEEWSVFQHVTPTRSASIECDPGFYACCGCRDYKAWCKCIANHPAPTPGFENPFGCGVGGAGTRKASIECDPEPEE